MLTLLDEYTRECLATDVERRLDSEHVLERLAQLFVTRGAPAYLRSGNSAEFTAHAVREWLGRLGVRTLYVEPGTPWESGYVESLNGKLRGELLDGGIFSTLPEAKALIARWRQQYKRFRPHSALGPASVTRSDRNQATGNQSAPTDVGSRSNIGGGLTLGADHPRAGPQGLGKW